MTKRAVIYARVSTDEQRDNYSIPTQIEQCLAYTAKNKYSLVGDCYVNNDTGFDVNKGEENAIPAYVDDYTSLELSRPGINNMLSFLDKTGFDVLVVLSVDRLARDLYIRETLEREIDRLGARVEYVQGNYDDSADGEIRKDLETIFAKWENQKRVERSMRGMRRRAESGLYTGGMAPFGYIGNDDVPGGLEINETQAKVVRFIFDRYVEYGTSIREIVRELGRKGFKTARGRKTWSKSTVWRILTNETYAGKAYYYRREVQRNGKTEFRDRKEWIEIDVEPIIGKDQFKAAQNNVERNKEMMRKRSYKFYLLSGMVRCSRCGKPYNSQTQKAGQSRRKNDAQSYRHRISNGHCCNKMVSARVLEPKVWERVKEVLINPSGLYQSYKAMIEKSKENKVHLERHMESLKRSRINIELKANNLTKVYIDPDINLSKKEYMIQREEIETETNAINKQIQIIENQLISIPQPIQWENLESFIKLIQVELADNQLTKRKKRQLYEILHLVVYIDPENGDLDRIDGWFNFDDNDSKNRGNGPSGGAGGFRSHHDARWSTWSRQNPDGARRSRNPTQPFTGGSPGRHPHLQRR